MLQFVLGLACSGKSQYIVKRAAKASLNKKTIIIVPEQFSFETERAVLHTDEYNNENISVMSFTKLYSEVSRVLGFGQLPVMSDSERMVLYDIALKSSSEQLKIFDRFIKYPDFSSKIADIIRDFKMSAVDSREILSAAEAIGGSLGAKLQDIALVMSVFDSITQNKYLDTSDYLTRLYGLLSDFEYFNGMDVFIDSFTGFTGQQYKIIEKICEQADSLTVSLCSDNIDSDDLNIFYNINKTAKRITAIAKSRGFEILEPVRLSNNYYSNTSMRNLEACFSRPNDIKELTDGTDNVRIISCRDPREEAFAAITAVKNLVINEGYRYRDFIIVARNENDYKSYIESFCKKTNVPCFIDKKVSLTETVLYIYINSLLSLKLSFSTENILSWLKSSLNGYSFEDICAIEEYIFIWGIKGSDWEKPWKMNPAGFDSGELTAENENKLQRLNVLREDIYRKLSSFCDALNGTVKEKAKVIYNFLISENVPLYLSDICNKAENENDKFTASVLRQAWDSVIKILDSLTDILADNYSVKDFINAFTVSAKAVLISNIPQMLDEVTFGSADRIRPFKPKISIILGANQGIFPNNSQKSGILASADKQRLEAYGISLNDDEIKSAVEENYLVYSMLCCPVDKCFVFYSRGSVGGGSPLPSAFIMSITSKLTNLKAEIFSPFSDKLFLPVSCDSAYYLLSELYREEFETVKNSLQKNEYYSDKLLCFENRQKYDSFNVSRENSASLFGDSIYLSASKFDNFHTCRLLYFLRYGLKVQKIMPADLNAAQRGTLIHFIFEALIKKFGKGLGGLSNSQISKEIDCLVEDYIRSISGSEMIMTPRFKFLLSKISASSKEIAYHLAEEFRVSNFEPAYCELEIGKDGDVPELHFPITEGEMILTGKVDRVDLYKNVIRIVDYKTNSKKFDLSDTLYGLNMQMLIYLYALIRGKNPLIEGGKAGGILYVPAGRSSSDSLAMNGLILDDTEVIEAMDEENTGRFIPEYNGKNQSFIDQETFSLIFDKIEQLIFNMGSAIREGSFSPEPVDGVNSSACKYCDFAPVCNRSEDEHIKVKSLKNHEIKEMLKGGEAGEI